MAYAELIEEAKKLSEDKIPEVIDFIRFLNAEKSYKKERKSNLLHGKLKYLKDDFDETPECFKEYM